MKSKILITGLAVLALGVSSCSKKTETVTPKKPNRHHLSKEMPEAWNSATERCTVLSDNCMPWLYPSYVPGVYSVTVGRFTDIVTNPDWTYTDGDFTTAETAYLADKYDVSQSVLTGMSGYEFFDLIFPEVLTQTEFSDMVGDSELDKTIVEREEDGVFAILFGSQTDPDWVFEASIYSIEVE